MSDGQWVSTVIYKTCWRLCHDLDLISASGVRNLVKIELQTQKSIRFGSIIKKHLEILLHDSRFIFYYDNHPKHTASTETAYLDRKIHSEIQSVVDWPPQSPDIIEAVWDQNTRQKVSTGALRIKVPKYWLWSWLELYKLCFFFLCCISIARLNKSLYLFPIFTVKYNRTSVQYWK